MQAPLPGDAVAVTNLNRLVRRPKDEQAMVGTPDFDGSRSTEALSAP